MWAETERQWQHKCDERIKWWCDVGFSLFLDLNSGYLSSCCILTSFSSVGWTLIPVLLVCFCRNGNYVMNCSYKVVYFKYLGRKSSLLFIGRENSLGEISHHWPWNLISVGKFFKINSHSSFSEAQNESSAKLKKLINLHVSDIHLHLGLYFPNVCSSECLIIVCPNFINTSCHNNLTSGFTIWSLR